MHLEGPTVLQLQENGHPDEPTLVDRVAAEPLQSGAGSTCRQVSQVSRDSESLLIAGCSSSVRSRRTRGDSLLSLHLVVARSLARTLMSAATPRTRSYSGCFSCRGIKKKCTLSLPPASTRSLARLAGADPLLLCVPGLEDFDAEGRCGRCVSRGVHCERTKPVRKPGGNPHGKRANSTTPNSTAKTRNARTTSTASANGHGHGQSHLTTPPSLDDLSTVALSMAGKDGHHHQHHPHHLQYGA